MTSNKKSPGKLYVFEGPDEILNKALSKEITGHLSLNSIDVIYLSFYRENELYLKAAINSQLLDISERVKLIENVAIPALEKGTSVVIDRFWWTTSIKDVAIGLCKKAIDKMIKIEKLAWAEVVPTKVFLLTQKTVFNNNVSQQQMDSIINRYDLLAEKEKCNYPVERIFNNIYATETISSIIDQIVSKKRNSLKSTYSWGPTKITPVFETYWRFAAERQNVFFNRIQHKNNADLTKDPVLLKYKFTNVYRASDRVSQFLIRNVIYDKKRKEDDLLFRILIFKTFNKIETWNLLLNTFDDISWENYDFNKYDALLSEQMNHGASIYSAAYIMPSGGRNTKFKRKHQNHLKLIEKMMHDNITEKICQSNHMSEVFDLLRSYPMIGDFLAYQYAVDINYSELTNFSEMSFVVPGPGAKDGIRKCFSDYGGLSEIDIIKRMVDRQDEEFEHYGINFKNLWGRPLQLIDCQNLFCEVDKYSRIVHPDIKVKSGRTRIKQQYKANTEPIDYFFPPKWGINAYNKNKGQN